MGELPGALGVGPEGGLAIVGGVAGEALRPGGGGGTGLFAGGGGGGGTG